MPDTSDTYNERLGEWFYVAEIMEHFINIYYYVKYDVVYNIHNN